MAGRPTKHTAAAETEIMGRLATGESLRHICADDHLPHEATVRNWVVMDAPAGISTRYAHARSLGLDSVAEEIIEISDTCREGVIRKQSAKDGESIEVRDMVDRAKLQVDARKWLLSKMRPDKYGDRTAVEHSGPAGGPVEHRVVFVRSNGDGKPEER